MYIRKNQGRTVLFRYLLAVPLSLGLTVAAIGAKAQEPPKPATPPPPPPSPDELFKKINPFKKHKDSAKDSKPSKEQSVKPADTALPAGPPPPPNPLNLFKKKNKTATPPAPASTEKA